jgi:undecaprenyl-diphosphatase
MLLLLAAATVPMALTVFILPYVERVSQDNDIIAEGVCFLLTSILLFLSDNCIKGYKTAADMKYRDAVAIGVAQAIAPFPGISRSGSTISVSLLAGLDREYAVAFSFLMGVAPVLGANLMEISDAGASAAASGIPTGLIWMGVGVAFAVGVLAIFLVKWLVKIENFRVFAWYTMILGVLTIGIGIFERLTGHMIQELSASFLTYIA